MVLPRKVRVWACFVHGAIHAPGQELEFLICLLCMHMCQQQARLQAL